MSEVNAKIEIYDTTLRDGTQGEGVSFSLHDKLKIAQLLDDFGVDYIEGGYPLSNPKDVAFFEEVKNLNLKNAKICAFGMTRRKETDPKDDIGMQALVNSGAPVITIVGKTWDLHVDEVLRVSREENLAMIRDSVAYCADNIDGEVFYDAEHFFDGYKANTEYALETLKAAVEGGATRLVLCDTNGGSMPDEVGKIIDELKAALGEDVKLGIHVHNDGGLAVANSLRAVEHGAVQVQGTINGIGERCGNVDLLTVAANLELKMPFTCMNGDASLKQLTKVSRYIYELANMNMIEGQPFVGSGAFAHKGGMHVHAVQRLARSYEHIEPDLVGNSRRILISELSGVSNVNALLPDKFKDKADKDVQRKVLERVQDYENEGYQFEAARASFELLLYQELGLRKQFWDLDHYRCDIYKADEQFPETEAVVKLKINDEVEHRVAEGDGPVNAIDGALRKCLKSHYPMISKIHLVDYKVRVVNATAESAAKVRVIVEFAVKEDGQIQQFYSTIGVSENIVEASWQALVDAFEWYLHECHIDVS